MLNYLKFINLNFYHLININYLIIKITFLVLYNLLL